MLGRLFPHDPTWILQQEMVQEEQVVLNPLFLAIYMEERVRAVFL